MLLSVFRGKLAAILGVTRLRFFEICESEKGKFQSISWSNLNSFMLRDLSLLIERRNIPSML